MMEFLYSKSRKFRSRTFGGSGGGQIQPPTELCIGEKYGGFSIVGKV